MEQVAKLKRTWDLAPILQMVQKIPGNHCPCLYLSIVVQKIHSKMHPVSRTNTHHDVTNFGMVEITKTWISWEQNITFLRNKKILNLCLRWHFLRSYCFVAEVTFKDFLFGQIYWRHPSWKTSFLARWMTLGHSSIAVTQTS